MKAAFGWLSRYFSKGELLLWGCSMGCILLSFAAFDRGSYLTLAAMEDPSYLLVVIYFVMFLVNDGYGFLSWSRMQKRQQQRREELA